jgi:hypothetical protein
VPGIGVRPVGFATLGLSLLSLLLFAERTAGEQSDFRCGPKTRTPPRLYLASYQRMTIVNVPRERARTVKVPQSEAGDYPYNIVRRGGCFVVWSWVEKSGYTVSALDSGMRARLLASRTRLFIPSSDPNRIWVLLGERTHPSGGPYRAVRELSIQGEVTVPTVRLPGGRPPVASVGRWLLLFAPHRHSFIPWDPRTGETHPRLLWRRFGWPWATAYRNLLITCRRYCRSLLLTRVGARETGRIPAPNGYWFDESGGALSPDARRLAIPLLERKDAGQSVARRLAIVRLATGRVRIVPRSRVPDGYVYVSWASTGSCVYLAGGEERRTIVAYRLGARHAHRLHVRVGRFYGMAVG